MCVAALPLIGAVVSGVGALAQGAGASAEREQQAQQYDQQGRNYQEDAKAKREQAAVTQNNGAYKAQRKNEELDRVLGSQRAGYAGSGIALSGTALDTIEESAVEGALDVAAIRWNTQAEAQTTRRSAETSDANAANSFASAKSARKSKKTAFLAPVLGGVAKIASSFG